MMPGTDVLYTPTKLAAQMAGACSASPTAVADFASGDGGLLRMASERWPGAKLLATDISRAALSALQISLPGAESGRCDFLSARSRSKSRVLADWAGKIDLALLNPPFSCRGGTRTRVLTEFFDATCSTAMAFILHAFEYLSSDGEILAILPAGSISSEKDHQAWEQLRRHANVEVLSQQDRGTFDRCFPTTKLVHIRRGAVRPPLPGNCAVRVIETQAPLRAPVVIYRGKVQMHYVPKGRTPLAHSTDLKGFRLVLNGHRTKAGLSAVHGPFVAICRVGKPDREKIALHFAESEIAISDCIVVLACESKPHAEAVHSAILEHWTELASLYDGTGAKYITVAKIAGFVRQLGFAVSANADAKWQLRRSVNGASRP